MHNVIVLWALAQNLSLSFLLIIALREDWASSRVTLSDIHKEWFSQYHSLLEARDQGSKEDSFSDRDVSLGWAGLAAVLVAEGKWREAKEAVSKGENKAVIYVSLFFENIIVDLSSSCIVLCAHLL